MSKKKPPIACQNAIIWSLADTCAATSFSESMIKRLVEAGEFPSAIRIGARRKGWLRVEVEAWCAARVAAARGNA